MSHCAAPSTDSICPAISFRYYCSRALNVACQAFLMGGAIDPYTQAVKYRWKFLEVCQGQFSFRCRTQPAVPTALAATS